MCSTSESHDAIDVRCQTETGKTDVFSKGDFKFDTDGDGKTGTDADLTNVIKKGAGAYGGSALMAPWPALSDAEIANIVAFIRSLKQ